MNNPYGINVTFVTSNNANQEKSLHNRIVEVTGNTGSSLVLSMSDILVWHIQNGSDMAQTIINHLELQKKSTRNLLLNSNIVAGIVDDFMISCVKTHNPSHVFLVGAPHHSEQSRQFLIMFKNARLAFMPVGSRDNLSTYGGYVLDAFIEFEKRRRNAVLTLNFDDEWDSAMRRLIDFVEVDRDTRDKWYRAIPCNSIAARAHVTAMANSRDIIELP